MRETYCRETPKRTIPAGRVRAGERKDYELCKWLLCDWNGYSAVLGSTAGGHDGFNEGSIHQGSMQKNKYHPSLAVVASLFTAGRVFLSSETIAQSDFFVACMMMAVLITSGLIYLFFIIPVCAHEAEKCREAIKDICEAKEQTGDTVKEG